MNGLNVHVDESAFAQKSPSEQLFLIYKAVEGIDNNGCKFSRERHNTERKINWKVGIILGAGSFGGVAASVFSLWKFVLCR